MESLIILIPIALILVGIALATFIWAVRSGQYDDLESPAHRILYDDDEALIPPESRPHKPGAKAEHKQPDA